VSCTLLKFYMIKLYPVYRVVDGSVFISLEIWQSHTVSCFSVWRSCIHGLYESITFPNGHILLRRMALAGVLFVTTFTRNHIVHLSVIMSYAREIAQMEHFRSTNAFQIKTCMLKEKYSKTTTITSLLLLYILYDIDLVSLHLARKHVVWAIKHVQ